MTDTFKHYSLVRTDVPHVKNKDLIDVACKFVCTQISVVATSEEEARALAGTPQFLPAGHTVLANNTIDPYPPYAWCYDSEPEAWLDPARSECVCYDHERAKVKLDPVVGPSRVGQRAFREIPR